MMRFETVRYKYSARETFAVALKRRGGGRITRGCLGRRFPRRVNISGVPSLKADPSRANETRKEGWEVPR